MANSLNSFFVDALSLMAERLGQKLLWYGLIPADVSASIADQGETVKVPIPPVVSTSDVTDGVVADGADLTPTSANVELTHHRAAPFQITDRERRAVKSGTLSRILESAVDGLAGYIDRSIATAVYRDVHTIHGTPGTALFSATAGITALNKGTRLLNEQVESDEGRRSMVVGSAALEGLRSITGLVEANKRGSDETIRTGLIGEVFGVNIAWSPNAPRHTAGTGTKTVNGAAAKGETSVTVDGAGTFTAGDIVAFAGGKETYTVTAPVAAAGTQLLIAPALTRAVADNAAITRTASHDVSLLFEGAFAAMAFGRLEGVVTPGAGRVVASLVDPASGVPLRYVIRGVDAKEKHFIDALWGAKTVRPELAIRLVE